ncbi:leucine-rich repeat receptor-like serine/threonine/tyrosine-protein kinase SOBIR1 precursor [Solanum lycopersicum]|uniref:Leucine-rich repeat receptor-like kinase n=1 Tax=Solanum lycopersicum TaxID=4081 RepID=A0A0M3L7B4_SOLLC|nr:leucine-rich repeat receptor-like serine/threonine/tyrosine-protein kinase SOBIR1 precursor [Solanum lycopersicum]AHW85125.1 leucine-rich repeat receptor-like kinase [Solanum lycopersicum]
MTFTASYIHLSFLSFFTVILLVQAKLNLYSPDHSALLLVQKGLGIPAQRNVLENPCNSVGISCEKRLINNSNVLRVTRVVFKSYGLKGTLSPAIGRLSELKELSLQNNKLFDRIPTEIVDSRKLEILNLQNNQFSGKVPPELSSLVRLRILDLGSNELSGNLNFLKYFPNLEKLSLADNMFTGRIPQSLKSFRNLRLLNISDNSFLEGTVPVVSQVEHLSTDLNRKDYVLKRYILAENATRPRHSPAMAPESKSRYAQAPGPSTVVVPVKKDKHNKIRRKVGAWILGFFAGVFAGGLSALIFSVLCKVLMFLIRGIRNDPGLTIFSPLIKKAEHLAFLENEDGLESLELIGQGGCGKVYKAALPGSDGKIIAVKKIIQPPKDAAELTEEDSKAMNKKMRQIKSEIKIVGQIRHRNLLPLLAHMPRPDCHYLVYEYMKNGSLQDTLQQVREGKRELDWSARHRIAMGIAAGLEYLHINHTQRIIHRDLKPGNVLLDDDMEARIADFGLAKAVPDAHTHITTSNVAGTIGYIAPEYHQTLKFTDKCDIYSFGVLLGVLVMGKLPSDEFFQNTSEMSLVKWMRNVMTSEDPNRAIDPKLMGNGNEDQMLLVLKIACFCTMENPKERPNSKDVRCMLMQIKH